MLSENVMSKYTWEERERLRQAGEDYRRDGRFNRTWSRTSYPTNIRWNYASNNGGVMMWFEGLGKAITGLIIVGLVVGIVIGAGAFALLSWIF